MSKRTPSGSNFESPEPKGPKRFVFYDPSLVYYLSVSPVRPERSPEFHPKFIQALSSSSGLFGALWPAIVDQASWDVRFNILRNICTYFRDLCREHKHSDSAKSVSSSEISINHTNESILQVIF